MATPPMTGATGFPADDRLRPDAAASAVAWPAIIGGAFAAAALTLILLALGAGFGLLSVSPWPGAGASATTFTAAAAVWLIVVQWLASALGGYLTGRLRTKWIGLHTHEVFFRDTANGLLSWAVATVVGVALLASAASAVTGRTAAVTGEVAAGASQGATRSGGGSADPTAYFVDLLFRPGHPGAGGSDQEARAQTTRILLAGVRNGGVSASDQAYLAQLVAARTGLSQADAQQRVGAVLAEEKTAAAKLRAAADAARKAGAVFAICAGLSLLIGAFIACVAAALGGRQRDAY